jgi:hypothetical protein
LYRTIHTCSLRFWFRYLYRESQECQEAEEKHRRMDRTGGPTQLSETLLLRLVTVLSSPEDYMCMEAARCLFPPYDVPAETMCGDKSEYHSYHVWLKHLISACHNFKHALFRVTDSGSMAGRLATHEKDPSSKEESPLAQIVNDLFREVVLPNLLDMGEWNKPERRDIENALADLQISLIVR